MEYHFIYNKNSGTIISLEQYTYIDREEFEVIRFNGESYIIEDEYVYGEDFIEAYSDFANVIFIKDLEDLMSYMQSKIDNFVNEAWEEDDE